MSSSNSDLERGSPPLRAKTSPHTTSMRNRSGNLESICWLFCLISQMVQNSAKCTGISRKRPEASSGFSGWTRWPAPGPGLLHRGLTCMEQLLALAEQLTTQGSSSGPVWLGHTPCSREGSLRNQPAATRVKPQQLGCRGTKAAGGGAVALPRWPGAAIQRQSSTGTGSALSAVSPAAATRSEG